MELKGSHKIRAASLRELKNELNELPDSVLDTANVIDADVDIVEERTFHGDYFVNAWYLRMNLEWVVDPE